MQPQTLPAPGYAPQTQPPTPPRKNGHVALWVVVCIVVAALAAGGVWWWQQGRVDSLSRANADITSQLNTAKDQIASLGNAQTTTFGESKVPFTFSYPSSWILSSDATILYDKDLPVSYSITLSAPGTVNSQTPTGGSAVTAGALINIAVLPAASANVKDLALKPTSGPAPTTTDVTVSSNPGIRYQITESGKARMYTDMVKNSVEYRISFEAKDDLVSNPNYDAYTALVTSFKLK